MILFELADGRCGLSFSYPLNSMAGGGFIRTIAWPGYRRFVLPCLVLSIVLLACGLLLLIDDALYTDDYYEILGGALLIFGLARLFLVLRGSLMVRSDKSVQSLAPWYVGLDYSCFFIADAVLLLVYIKHDIDHTFNAFGFVVLMFLFWAAMPWINALIYKVRQIAR